MQLEILGRTYDMYFGLDFLDFIESKHSPVMEIEGQKFSSGIGGLALLESKMSQYSQSALADVLVGGTVSENNKLNRKVVEKYFNSLSDEDFFKLYDEVVDELGKSSALKRAEKAQKMIKKSQ